MTMKYTIADILHIAADEYLAPDHASIGYRIAQYSCDAIHWAVYKLSDEGELGDTRIQAYLRRIKRGLERMGLNVYSMTAFSHIDDLDERQQARYGWLKFAALIAEEQPEEFFEGE